jgi:transposase
LHAAKARIRGRSDAMNGNTGNTGNSSNWVGIDVSKSKLDVAVLDERDKIKNRVFDNNAKGHAALVAWLHERGGTALRICMEATGAYSDVPAMALCDAGFVVSVVNPVRIKGFAQSQLMRNKNDRADAALLARFGLAMQPEPWAAAPMPVRSLRGLVERLQSLKDMHQQEANRLEAANAGSDNEPMRQSIQSHMAWLQDSIKKLERQIDDHIDRHPDLRGDAQLITSIPGLGKTTAAKVMAYLGDVRRFDNGKALAAFVGVTPKQKQSGSSVKGRTSISRTGHASVRHRLYMPAMVAMKHNPLVSVFGQLKQSGLAPKAVIAACMHKLVLLIYGVMRSGRPFDANFCRAGVDFQDGI